MSTTHTVTAPVVGVYLPDRTVRYLYQGAVLPEGLAEGEGDRLAALALVSTGEELVAPTGLDPVRDSDLLVVNPAGEALETGVPKLTAPKAAWVQYAVTQGATTAEAEAQTREQLVATYGT